MATKLISREWCSCLESYRVEYVCDTVEEATALPACCPGSQALVPGAGKLYMVNASGQWTEFGSEE